MLLIRHGDTLPLPRQFAPYALAPRLHAMLGVAIDADFRFSLSPVIATDAPFVCAVVTPAAVTPRCRHADDYASSATMRVADFMPRYASRCRLRRRW